MVIVWSCWRQRVYVHCSKRTNIILYLLCINRHKKKEKRTFCVTSPFFCSAASPSLFLCFFCWMFLLMLHAFIHFKCIYYVLLAWMLFCLKKGNFSCYSCILFSFFESVLKIASKLLDSLMNRFLFFILVSCSLYGTAETKFKSWKFN